MMKFIKIPTCKEVYHQNHKEGSGHKLSLKQLILKQIHLFVCANCRRLEDGLDLIQNKMTQTLKQKSHNIDEDKINKLKHELKEKIKNQTKN